SPKRKHMTGIVHAVGDDRRIRLCRAELLPHRGVRTGKFGVQHDAERDIQFPEQSADARNAPVDGVLTKSFVHEVRVAACQVRAEHRALTEAELLDEEYEADRDPFAARPGRDMNRVARKAGDPIDSVLRKDRRRKVNSKYERHSGNETELPGLRCQKLDDITEIHG